jgi:hypothetical protein
MHMYTSYAIYFSMIYSVASITEWVIHRYVMHVYSFKTSFGLLHKTHHLNTLTHYESSVFDWNFTASTFFSTWFITTGGLYWIHPVFLETISMEIHTGVILIFAVGFTLIWNTIHPDIHKHPHPRARLYPWYVICPSVFVYFPSWKPILRTLFRWHYKHHLIHHTYPYCNYNVVFLGADIVFGTQKMNLLEDARNVQY